MTGEEAFRLDPSPLGVRDREAYGSFAAMPSGLRDWWNCRAPIVAEVIEHEVVLDWNEVKKAARAAVDSS